MIIVDEGHHAPASSYTSIFASLDFLGAGSSDEASGSGEEEEEGGRLWARAGRGSGLEVGSSTSSSSSGAAGSQGAAGLAAGQAAAGVGEPAGAGGEEGELDQEVQSLLSLSQGDRLLVGFTATPYRLCKKRTLADVFQVGRALRLFCS